MSFISKLVNFRILLRVVSQGLQAFGSGFFLRDSKGIFYLVVLFGVGPSISFSQSPYTDFKVTHGPVLGRPGPTTMSVWVRTNIPGEVSVRYGTERFKQMMVSDYVDTVLENDNTAVITLTNLYPDTLYYYTIDKGLSGTFRTLPEAADYVDENHNPEGLFNFQFEFVSCQNQNPNGSAGPSMPIYDTLNDQVADKVHFAIMNGDWLYEEDRDFPVEAWMNQTRLEPNEKPEIVELAPALVGVWENYKTYMSRGRNMMEWHSRVPSFFTFDDHEVINDAYGTAEAGYVDRRAVFRDTAVKAWFDYLGWANPVAHNKVARFGKGAFKEGSDILYDPKASFNSLTLEDFSNIMVHWGKATDGVQSSVLDAEPGDPNAGVYDIVEIIDDHHLRIQPAGRANGDASYSIGRRSYGSFRVANCEFFLLDTRSHRSLHDVSNPAKPGASMLGKQQLNWLKESIDRSDADFFFMASSVTFMIPHVGNGGASDTNASVAKDDAWTVFIEEREDLIGFFEDRPEKQFFMMTGDLHNSFAVNITPNTWEFASGPANSINHVPATDEANRPANGTFKYGPRECDIRWSTYLLEGTPRLVRQQQTYCVVQVNNVFNSPMQRGDERWVAYPHPQVIFKYYDAYTGELRYSESIVSGMKN